MWGLRREVHGTVLRRCEDVLLTGANLLVERSGAWHCESLEHRSHLVEFFASDTFDAVYPGNKPRLAIEGGAATLSLSHLRACDFGRVDAPVLLATPAEPDNWGRWVVQVIPKLDWFQRHGGCRKLMC
jgi:hypothetical protein